MAKCAHRLQLTGAKGVARRKGLPAIDAFQNNSIQTPRYVLRSSVTASCRVFDGHCIDCRSEHTSRKMHATQGLPNIKSAQLSKPSTVPAPHNEDARVSDEELRLLLSPAPVDKDAGISNSFWYRNAFMLCLSIFQTVLLLVFPEEVFRAFGFPAGATDMARYLQMAGWFGVMMTVLYGYSYLWDWEFERVSLICFSVLLTNFWHDFFYIYNINVSVPWSVIVVTLLRFLAVSFLFVNVIKARNAPPVHQRLWPRWKR